MSWCVRSGGIDHRQFFHPRPVPLVGGRPILQCLDIAIVERPACSLSVGVLRQPHAPPAGISPLPYDITDPPAVLAELHPDFPAPGERHQLQFIARILPRLTIVKLDGLDGG